MSEPLENEGNPTIELGLRHMMDGTADQFPHAYNVTSDPGPEFFSLPKGAQILPRNDRVSLSALGESLKALTAEKERVEQNRLRAIVREEVDRALHPGTVDARQYRHVDITDSDGTRWRGMVYLVEPMEGDKR